ncbi:MAG TPA: T9SS type A sorting domain-containing protein, partial [bacterium]
NDDINEWLFVSHSSDNGTTWSDPDTLAKDMHPGIVSSYFCFPHLAAGPNGKIGFAYREKDTNISALYQLYFQEYNGAGWSVPELITTFSDSIDCYQASIAYDSKGRLHCAFYTDEVDWPSFDLGQIYYAWKDEGGSWSDPIAITSEPTGKADYPAIAIGPNDALYVVYLQNSYTSGSPLLQVFAVSSADRGVSWSDTVRISDGTVNMALRSASIGKHPRPAGVGGSAFEGGADLLWVQPDASEPDGNAICYGRIPWVETTKIAHDNSKSLPATYQLNQNYPNPFNSITAIRLQLKNPGHVRLKVYNIRGEEVATIVDKNMLAGSYNISFDASKLPAAIYYYQLSVNEYVTTRKMIVLK